MSQTKKSRYGKTATRASKGGAFIGPARLSSRPVNAIAVDLGAESCRVSLASWHKARLTLQTIYRFPNAPIQIHQHLFWDIAAIQEGVLTGVVMCAEQAGGPIDSIGVDGWAVDYVRLNRDLLPLSNPFCYRDPRTEFPQHEVWEKISPARIYSITGIQHLRFNTLYQLYADQCAKLPSGTKWLNIPEYILSYLGGLPVSEYTNATHTQMLNAESHDWSKEIFRAAGLNLETAPKVVPPGTVLGTLSCPLLTHPSLKKTILIAPACHDTGSAVAGIPAEGDEWAFISSGTWSLVGTPLPRVCSSESAMNCNFSNEGGLGGQVRFLKNVNGMWLLQECLRHWQKEGAHWDIPTLIKKCAALSTPAAILDVGDPSLLLQGAMPDRINDCLLRNGANPLHASAANAPDFANLILHSLAARYDEVLSQIRSVTGKALKRIYIVGGGSRNQFLNGLIADRTKLEVHRGPVESSLVGNLAVQFAVLEGDRTARSGVNAQATRLWACKLSAASTD